VTVSTSNQETVLVIGPTRRHGGTGARVIERLQRAGRVVRACVPPAELPKLRPATPLSIRSRREALTMASTECIVDGPDIDRSTATLVSLLLAGFGAQVPMVRRGECCGSDLPGPVEQRRSGSAMKSSQTRPKPMRSMGAFFRDGARYVDFDFPSAIRQRVVIGLDVARGFVRSEEAGAGRLVGLNRPTVERHKERRRAGLACRGDGRS
jgi:hypothetical protein